MGKTVISLAFLFCVFASGSMFAQSDSTSMFNALDYSLQKRYLERGEKFVSDKFTDNTFISIGGGVDKLVPRANSSFSWGGTFSLSFGKWFNAYNALRLSVSGEHTVKSSGFKHIYSNGIDVSHLFNLSSYFGGYKPSRFFELSTLEGLEYRYSSMDGNGINAFGLHLGFNMKMNLSPAVDLFFEPHVVFYTDGIDHSGDWNWRRYDISYGADVGVSYNFHSVGDMRKGPSAPHGSFVSLSAGAQFQNSDLVRETLGVAGSLGPYVNLSYGRYYTPLFGLRTSLFFSSSKWVEYSPGIRDRSVYFGLKLEGMLDIVALCGARDSRFSLPLLFGPEISSVTKKDSMLGNKSSFSFGLTGGLQLNCRILDNISVFLEPGATVVPYIFKDKKIDMGKTTGVNYFDFLVHFNLGLALYL